MIDTIQIRPLQLDDADHLQNMQTGIEDDYVVRIFDRLIESDEHALYGLFTEGQLVSVAGYSVFKDQYAMLGRLRSDQRFLGNGYATTLIESIVDYLQKDDQIKWIGANTQLHNFPALRVLEKLRIPKLQLLHAATLFNRELLTTPEGETWKPLNTLEEKRKWINPLIQDSDAIFPLEAYYPFPTSEALFSDEDINDWFMFENESRDRFVIVKFDQKRHQYAHVIYLWDDLFDQPGLWNTLDETLVDFKETFGDETYIRLDVPDETYEKIPNKDAFEFQDPWILHGYWK
ncbi:GNAT family N-acetyltransferase [Alkalibacillus aidingensis]|uniref:GNAT family N-acetyltransferase n=1 Tax=Alkalibacillus aidingensis TaxID=2747607 RepID=UPI001660868A|nr:GNAT family N-acetyltransferase [Alkalibacillus aidingensis]